MAFSLFGMTFGKRDIGDLVAQGASRPSSAKPAPEAVRGSTALQKIEKNKSGKITSLIGEGARFTGDLMCQQSVHISGHMIGNLRVSEPGGTASISSTAVFEGAIDAENVLVGGRVSGTIRARALRLYPSSVIEGDVYCERLLTDDGATLLARIHRYDESFPVGETHVGEGEEVDVIDLLTQDAKPPQEAVPSPSAGRKSKADVVEMPRTAAC